MLVLSSRILLRNGLSVVTPEAAAKYLLQQAELPTHLRIPPGRDAELFKRFCGIDIAHDGIVNDPQPTRKNLDLGGVLEFFTTPRDDTPLQQHEARVEEEYDFFVGNNLEFVLSKMVNLVSSFEERGIVWGVGRGSSCACYLFYLLGVHDINPIKYDISFTEFSKEIRE